MKQQTKQNIKQKPIGTTKKTDMKNSQYFVLLLSPWLYNLFGFVLYLPMNLHKQISDVFIVVISLLLICYVLFWHVWIRQFGSHAIDCFGMPFVLYLFVCLFFVSGHFLFILIDFCLLIVVRFVLFVLMSFRLLCSVCSCCVCVCVFENIHKTWLNILEN